MHVDIELFSEKVFRLMAMLLPLTSDGNREIIVKTGNVGSYRFRTYYSQGQLSGWFVDIRDTVGTPLLLGKRIVPGCPNLLKGQGDRFRGIQLVTVIVNGSETAPDSLGSGIYLLWFNPGETNPFNVGDPLIDIPYDYWEFGREVPNKLFGGDGTGNVWMKGLVSVDATDPLAALDAYGNVGIKPDSAPSTENEYMYIDDDGYMRMKD